MSDNDSVDSPKKDDSKSIAPVIPATPPRRDRQALNVNDNDRNNNSPAANSSDSREQAIPPTPENDEAPGFDGEYAPLSPLMGLEDMDEDESVQANDNDDENRTDDHGEMGNVSNENHTIHNNNDDDDLAQEDVDVTVTARGTDVDVRRAGATFRRFLQTFTRMRRPRNVDGDHNNENNDSDSDSELQEMLDDEGRQIRPIYLAKLEEILQRTSTSSSLDIDTLHLFHHNNESRKLYHQLVHYPMELIPLMDLVVQREARRIAEALQQQTGNEDEHVDVPLIQVRPFNLKEVSNLRSLDPIAMDSLVCLKGMIVRASPIIPDLKVAHFSCVICGNEHQASIERGRIQEPTRCTSCNTKNTFQLIHNRSLFADKQLIRLQETPDQVPPGQTPASVVTFCYDNLVDSCQPGDKMEVTGVLRAQPVRVNPKITKLKSIYKTYVDVIHFRPITGMDRGAASDTAQGTSKTSSKLAPERVEELKALARRPDIYDMLTKSLAPSIWELDNVKRGVLCMLFGGNHRRMKQDRNVENGTESHDEDDDDDDVVAAGTRETEERKLSKRGDINILLCGDPGTSKSQLLSYVHKLSSRGIYTSGKGSSAVGLTASVVRDPETRDLVLESGALVLSDRGICCIDEFDKMSDATRSILHEAMEQQTVSIAKAGIIASLNARTSILASANPLESRYNPNLSVVENIKLPPTLLSRFDLIYLILDSPNADQDRKLAQHLVGLYYEEPDVVEPPMKTELLRDYIDYARDNIHPLLSDEATQQLLESYLELRNPPGGNIGNNGTRTISATPRQLESLIRTSEALAKMRYSSVVTRADAQEAVRLLKVATQAAATDPRTGRIDMDMINTGRSAMDRELGEHLYTALKELLAERRGKNLVVRDISKQLMEISEQPVPQNDLIEALRRLDADGIVQFSERNQSVHVRSGIVT